MLGGTTKDLYIAGGSSVTQAKVEAECRKEQGVRSNPTKEE